MKEITVEQAIEIRKNLLQVFHELCEKNDLKYSLGYGTLLGAVRHGGMIPWDDDIDVVMPREDYDRLAAMYTDSESKEQYQLVNHRNHPEVKTKISYFIDYDTVTETAGKLNDYHGIHIDIYPVDVLPNGFLKKKFMLLKRYILQKIIKIKDLHPEVVKGKQRAIRKTLMFLFKGFDQDKMLDRLNSLARKFASVPEEQKKTVSCFVEEGKMISFPYEAMKHRRLYSYDGKEYYGFDDFDSLLSAWYGDYMTPPPADQRKRSEHRWVKYYYKA